MPRRKKSKHGNWKMISSLIDEVIDQLGQDKDSMTEGMVVVVEDSMDGNEKAHEEVPDYLKARDERVASMQAEFKRLFPGFDKEILEWGGEERKRLEVWHLGGVPGV